MSNNINGVRIDGNVAVFTSAEVSAEEIRRITEQAQRDAQTHGGQSITVVGNGQNVSRNGGRAGNGKR